MEAITKQYNYIFYLTVMALNWCSRNLIIKPIIKLMKSISISEKRINEIRKSQLNSIDNWDQGSNVIYAFGIMMWNMTCIILTLGFLILKTTKIVDDIYWTITFWIAVILSIIINYFSLWKSEKYRKYFNKFKLKNRSPKEIFGVAFIHLLTFLICGLIIKIVV